MVRDPMTPADHTLARHRIFPRGDWHSIGSLAAGFLLGLPIHHRREIVARLAQQRGR